MSRNGIVPVSMPSGKGISFWGGGGGGGKGAGACTGYELKVQTGAVCSDGSSPRALVQAGVPVRSHLQQ